jgi:hypothetical protein
MRCAVLAVLIAALCCGQSDPYVGLFQGDRVALELKGSGGKYTGTLTVQGQSFPATVSTSSSNATGTFSAAGRTYSFRLTPDGNGYKLTSEGVEYVLVRSGQTPVPPPASPAAPQPPQGSIVGSWRNARGYAQFNADGTGTVDGQSGRYEIHGDQLTMVGAQGQLTVRYTVQNDQLTLSTAAGSIVLERAKPDTGEAGVRIELVGKWCWISQVYANNGGARQSNRCITLNGNGSYQYFGLVDSYNPYGGATSQTNDSGTWTATDSTLITRSVSGRVTSYRLEKRNHPKNVRDPMIVLNGEAFVTYYNKPPW